MITTADLTAAIQRSIHHNETVTVKIGTDDPISVMVEMCVSELCEDYDSTELAPGITDVWGTDPDGNEWRLNLESDDK